MAKKHSSLTTSDLHHPKGILVESTASMLVMSQSISTATGSFHFIPGATNTYTLGNAARAWKELYVSTSSINFVDPAGNTVHSIQATADGVTFVSSSGEVADVSGSVISGSKLHIVGDSFIGGDLTLGDADSDSISIGADLTSNLIPNADNTYDFGTSAKQWKDIYINGIGYIDQLGTDGDPVAVYVNSGEIDGAVIGGESAAAITGTTIDATTDFTIGSTVITDDSIVMTPTSGDTATIAASTNGALTITTVDTAAAAANLLFTVDGTAEIASQGLITLDSGAAINLEPAAGSAILLDGTISIDAGVVTGATSITSTAFVGTVDGVVGGNTPAAGTFTNLQVTTDVNIDDSGGDGAMDGVIIGAATAAAGTFTTLNTTGLTALAGNVDLGDATGDTITATGRFDSDIVPSTDSARDLGTSALQFAEAHIDTGHIDAITATGTSTLTTVDINGGNIDGTAIGAASHSTIKGTTIDATTDFTIDGLVITADTITNDSNLTMDIAGDLSLDVDGGDVTITDNGAPILTMNATTISGSATASGSFAHIAVNSVSASRIEVDSIKGNWTNAGNTIANLGSVTTVDINGGTVDGITSLTAGGDLDIGAHDLRAATITADGLSSGRVVFAGTAGVLSDDSDFTFSTDTLTVTKLGAYEQAGSVDFSDEAMTNVNIDSGTITGITDLLVADGGTGASTLTDGGVLLGSGTGAITAMAVLADSEIIVGDGSGDPVAESGATLRTSIGVGTGDSPQFTAIELGHASNTTIARSGAGDITIEGNHIYRAGGTDVSVADGGTGASTLTDGGILLGSGTSAITAAAVLGDGEILIGDGTTDPVPLDIGSSTAITTLGTIGTGVWQGTVINDDYIDTINNANKVALTALDIDGGTDVGAAIVDADLIIIDDGAGGTNRKATMSRLKTYMSGVSGGSTLGNVQVGVTAAGEIDTTSGNLIIDSAGGTTTLDDHVIVSGDFTVSGTRTIVNSTTVDIADNIIELNAGTADGGIYVKETQGGAATGSMLWDVSSNRWFAGTAGSETNVVLVGTSDTLTNKTLTSPDINGGTWNGTVDGNSTAAGITWADLGSVTTIDINGGTINGITDLAVADGGTGASTLDNLITLTDHTTGNYVATITGGTGITSTAATSGEGTTHSLSVDAAQTQITSVGTIGTGVWNGTAVASAYLDADTAHLSTTQTFSGAKTFSSSITLGGHAVDDIDVTSEASDADDHLMTAAAIKARIDDLKGVTSNVAGTGISVSGATGAVTITNSGVTQLSVGSGLDVDANTGSVTLTVDLAEVTTETSIAQDDTVIMVDATDNGTGKISFTDFEDEIFGNISGDATAAAGGALSLAANCVDSSELVNGSVDDGHLSDGVATGLAGAGMTATSGVLNVIASTGITANADNITTNDSQIVHDSLSGFVANEHIDHSGVTLTAGSGLNGGGDITTNRTFAVDAAQTVITSLLATDIKIGEDNETKIDFETADTINFYTNNVHEFQMTSGGTFHADADVVAYSSTVASDEKLKTNINDTKYGLSDILKLRGVDFNWKEKFEGKRDVGFIAQEVQEIIPELVKEVDTIGTKQGEEGGGTHLTVDYAKVVPILVESIRELKKEIDDLKSN